MIPFYEKSDHNIRVFQSSGLCFPAHLHSQLELVYVLESEIWISINHIDYKFEKGDFIIIFPNTIHSYNSNNSENNSNNSILMVICGVMLTGDYMHTIINYHLKEPYIKSNDLHDDVAFAMKSLVMEASNKKDISVCKAFLQLILARILPHSKLIKNETIDKYDITYKIVNYISLHFFEPLSLEILARELGVSKYYLSRIFSNKLQTNFNDYVNNIRLSYAATLILTTDIRITQICNDAGFDSQRTFNRVFKETFYMTPSQYRYRNKQ